MQITMSGVRPEGEAILLCFALLGSKTPEGLREKLKAAMKTGNKEDIEDILDQCVAAGMPELEHDIQWCRRTLDQIEELDEHLHRG